MNFNTKCLTYQKKKKTIVYDCEYAQSVDWLLSWAYNMVYKAQYWKHVIDISDLNYYKCSPFLDHTEIPSEHSLHDIPQGHRQVEISYRALHLIEMSVPMQSADNLLSSWWRNISTRFLVGALKSPAFWPLITHALLLCTVSLHHLNELQCWGRLTNPIIPMRHSEYCSINSFRQLWGRQGDTTYL